MLNGDRESAAIVTLSALFGRRGGSICSVADNLCTGEKFEAGGGHEFAIDIALEGCAVLNRAVSPLHSVQRNADQEKNEKKAEEKQ